MRKLIVSFSVVFALLVGNTSYADNPDKKPVARCPKTTITDQDKCFSCHTTPSFKLKEASPCEGLALPNHSTWISRKPNGSLVGRFLLRDIDDTGIREAFQYFARHNIRHAIIEIHSPGGSLFAATRIVGLMRHYESRGMVIETRVHGFALSAGFFILANGTKGHRFANSHSELMWHEIVTFKMFDISSPADKEDEARVLRHLQTTVNRRLAEVSNLTLEELNERIRKREFWMNGRQALEFGFVDGLLD